MQGFTTIEEIITVGAGAVKQSSNQKTMSVDGQAVKYKFRCDEPLISVYLIVNGLREKALLFEGDDTTELFKNIPAGSKVGFEVKNDSLASVDVTVYLQIQEF